MAPHPCWPLRGPPGSLGGQEREPSHGGLMEPPHQPEEALPQGAPISLTSQEASSTPEPWHRLCQLLGSEAAVKAWAGWR